VNSTICMVTAAPVDFTSVQFIHTYELARAFIRQGFKVHLIAPYLDGENKIKTLRQTHGMSFNLIKLDHPLKHFFIECYFLKAVISAVRNLDISFIYERHTWRDIAPLASKLVSKLPYLLEVNGIISIEEQYLAPTSIWRKPYIQPLLLKRELTSFKAVDCIVAISHLLKKQLASYGIPHRKIIVVPNGVDTEKFRPRDQKTLKMQYGINGSPILIYVGSEIKWHGLEVILASLNRVKNEFPNFKLLVIGIRKNKTLEEILVKNKIAENVIFIGRVPHSQIPKYLAMADIALAPLKSERRHTTPFKILEYIASGKAIITTDVCELSKQLIKLNAAIQFNGTPQSLSEKIIEVYSNPKLKRKLEDKARQVAIKKYSWNRAARVIISTATSIKK